MRSPDAGWSFLPLVAITLLSAATALISPYAAAFAAELPEPETETDVFLEDAQQYAIRQGTDAQPLKLHEPALLKWTNPVRLQERGSLYIWTQQERPIAIGSMFTYAYNDKLFAKHEFHSLSEQPLKSVFGGTNAWAPKKPGISWLHHSDAPAPGTTAAVRNLQMRQIAKKYSAALFEPDGNRHELRLAPRALHEYTAPDAGVLQGAIFAYVVATDPEVLLIVEATSGTRPASDASSNDQPAYRWAFARFHYWKLAVHDGDKLVWEQPLDKAQEAYDLGRMSNAEREKTYISYHVKQSSALKRPNATAPAEKK